LIEYLDETNLEITVFDNSAPMVDEEDEKAKDSEDRDIIGIAKVPLKLLTLSKDISGPITILNSKGQHCGILFLKITVSDPLRKYASTQGGTGLAITALWEKDIIETISHSITKTTRFREVDAIFEIFSKKKEKMTQDDFKTAVTDLR
jgi:hypothetical protein